MVFDRVLCPAFEHLCDLGPLVPVLLLQNEKDQVFLGTPLGLFDFWVQVVVPSLTTLLAYFARQMLGDFAPVARALLLHELDEESVLIWAP